MFLTSDVRTKFGVDTEENEPYKVAHLAEKSEKGSISNLSTKPAAVVHDHREGSFGGPAGNPVIRGCVDRRTLPVPSKKS